MEIREESKIFYQNLSLNISYYRKRSGLTQEQVAEYVGITSKYLSEIETSSKLRPCSLEVVFRIAKALDVMPDKLFQIEK